MNTRDEILAEYQQWRQVGRKLNGQMVGRLTKDELHEAGRRLGILHKGTLCFEHESVMAVFQDYALRHIRRGSRNAIEHYLAETPPTDDRALRWLKSQCGGRYRILRANSADPGFSLEVVDLLRNETGQLIDIGFSQTVTRGDMLASNVTCFDRFWVTTGAGLPLAAPMWERLSKLLTRFGRRDEDFRTLSAERNSELATVATRALLDARMSERVLYTDSPSRAPGPHYAARRPSSASVAHVKDASSDRVGRNAPCPCGSGRKFKHCCLR